MSRPELITLGSSVHACEQTVKYLKTKLETKGKEPDKVNLVERHVGRIDTADELKRWIGQKSGGIRLAALNIPSMQKVGHELIGTVNFAAYIFVTDSYGYQKDIRAEVLVAMLAQSLTESAWIKNAGASSQVSQLKATNLYSGQIDKLGVAIWSVTWSQDWPLNKSLDLNSLDDFNTFGMKAKIADGAPELEGEIKLLQENDNDNESKTE